MFSYYLRRFWKSSNRVRCIYIAVTIIFCVVLYMGTNSLQQQQRQQQQVEPEVVEVLPTGDVTTTAAGQVQRQLKYVVETSTCKIPEMNPFDRSIKDFLRPDFGYPVDCKANQKSWTFVNERDLVINATAVHESGYSMASIHCCYRIIERVEQPWSDYDINADNYVKYSDKCHPIFNGAVTIDADFIRVHCISKLPPFYNDVVYRDFFAVVQPSSDRLVSRKLSNWKPTSTTNSSSKTTSTLSSQQTPPNVVIIGIDNNSRMNAQRNLPKTLQALRRIGAVELLGYTKVAENTNPNTVPFLSGYSVKQLEPLCYKTDEDPQDDCPFIWKAFDSANYLTAHAEDAPYLGGFNYLRTGFLRKPTDFYLRPVMLAVMTYMPRFDYYHTDCIGRQMTDEFTFKYILDVIRLAAAHDAPVFVHSWLTSLAHHNYNNIKFGDESISSFIEGLINSSNDNTIFFFMSDHGQRYGPIRETSQGWYEDKLPTQWVYIPQRIQTMFPEWRSNLKNNSARLTSHFDVYKTMLQILKAFTPTTTTTDHLYAEAKHQFGMSLFEPIPENRTCDQAGISVNFCACSKPKSMNIRDEKVVQAAGAAVKHLKSLVPLDVCAEPILKNIVAAGYLDLPNKPVYVITLATEPGDFLFEVNVELEEGGNFVISTDLLRMNKITRAANCVKTPLLERYCYCK